MQKIFKLSFAVLTVEGLQWTYCQMLQCYKVLEKFYTNILAKDKDLHIIYGVTKFKHCLDYNKLLSLNLNINIR